ncbi:FtsX-like permease family protein [Leifsonia sp. McL0607]|uniref:FtsX-like permease family protein n=1 Tax=Leifsonia sp. McL0607 TaxID=3415672 RepID=UPI003CEDB38D
MILKLVTTELLVAWRLWSGAFVLAVFAALIACVCAGDFSTARAMWGDQPEAAAGLINHAFIYMGFNVPVVIGALNILLTYVVDLQRPRYALWQLAGVGPRTIRSVIFLQALFLGLVAFAIALILAAPTLNLFLNTLSAPLRTEADPIREVTLGVFEFSIAFLVFMAVVLLSALGAARKARRTPILAAIRTPEVVNAPLSTTRIVLAIVCAIIAIVSTVLLCFTPVGYFVLGQMMILVAFLFAAPWVSERVMRLWVALLPGRKASWYVARESAKYNVTRSHAGISLMVIACGLGMVTGVAGLWSEPRTAGLAIAVFGTPLVLVLYAGAATIIMTSGHRRRDTTLLTISGATRTTALASAAFEALIFTLTAGIISLVVALPFVFTPAPAPNATGEVKVATFLPLVPIPFVLALGIVLMFVAIARPVIQAGRNSPAAEMRRSGI